MALAHSIPWGIVGWVKKLPNAGDYGGDGRGGGGNVLKDASGIQLTYIVGSGHEP